MPTSTSSGSSRYSGIPGTKLAPIPKAVSTSGADNANRPERAATQAATARSATMWSTVDTRALFHAPATGRRTVSSGRRADDSGDRRLDGQHPVQPGGPQQAQLPG